MNICQHHLTKTGKCVHMNIYVYVYDYVEDFEDFSI